MTKLIITEKPSVARDIAKVLKVSSQKDGYLEGNGYQITWALGHLIQLVDPDEYGEKFKTWSLQSLPILPETFQTKVIPDRLNQYKVVEKLLGQEGLEEVVCATDAGREGELIFRLIYEKSTCEKPVSRLWISSQTDKAIKEGFEALKPGASYVPLFHSALCRSQADWLIGMNASRAYTVTCSQGQGVMSVGRVQTPVLKMIVDRYLANRDFVSTTFYELFASCQHAQGSYEAKWTDLKEFRVIDVEKAKAIQAEVFAAGIGTVTEVIQKEKAEKQPLLYDLTELQKEANRRFKFSADHTLKLMQNLYERHKILTYPRTSSRYLSSDLQPKLPELVNLLSDIQGYEGLVAKIQSTGTKISKRMVDDKKVTDHHAIIPTDKKPVLSELSADEFAVYDLVIRRFLAAFLPECLKDQTDIMTQFGAHLFKTTGIVVREIGWRAAYADSGEEKNDDKAKEEEEDGALLPPVKKGDTVRLESCDIEEGQTKAPALYNEATILAAMETAGKQCEDDELRQAMKDCGLGTPATRAQILERLITVGYIVRDKNRLIPTPKGEYLIQSIRDEALLSPELTGLWEKKLNEMAQGRYSREDYMNEITDFTTQVVENVSEAYGDPMARSIGMCPKCKEGDVLETPRAFSCSNWKERQCDFTIWKSVAGKVIGREIAESLLTNPTTELIEGFKSKKGTDFAAKLAINESFQVGFVFENGPAAEIGTCPLCQGQVASTPKAYGCRNWKETGCTFTIWKTIAGRAITEVEAKSLLEHGMTEKLSGFVSKAGKPFDAVLRLVDGKAVFQFDN